MNQEVKIKSRSRSIAQAITRSIEQGEVPVGSFLPPARTLASQFGVSLNTVQVALRELETRQMIESIPRRGSVVKMSVPPTSESARPISQIGVIVPWGDYQQQNTWAMRILHAAEQVLFDANASLLLLPFIESVSEFRETIVARVDRLRENLHGVLVFGSPRIEPILRELEDRAVPWVSIGPPTGNISYNFVASDYIAGGRLVGRCFGKLGYERVAILTDDVAFDPASLEKITGFFQGCLELHVPTHGIDVITCADWRGSDWYERDGYTAVKALIEQGKVPQGIFAAGDNLAIGAMQALAEAGIKVPDEVGVVGSTGVVSGERCSPKLTVVAQRMEEMGCEATRMLMEMSREGIRRMVGRRIRGRFIVRESLPITNELKEELETYAPPRNPEQDKQIESSVISSQ